VTNHRNHPEGEKERVDRELMELLQELRVAVVGIQVLFAFLLTVPFTLRFETVTTFQRDIYFVTLLLAALASVFLIAPSAQHRILFRQQDKARLLKRSNVLALIGMIFVALAITGVVLLITDLLFSTTAVIVTTAGIGLMFALFWFADPLGRRYRKSVE
jgi:hypothetical protein